MASEVTEAEAYLDALQERVKAGDPDVSPTEISHAREMVEFARLREEAARRQAEAERTAARLAALQPTADGIRAYTGNPDKAVKLLKAVHDSLTAFIDYTRERAEFINTARRTLHEHDVPEYDGQPGNRPEHAGLFWASFDRSVGVDGKRVTPLDPGAYIGAMLAEVARTHGPLIANGRDFTGMAAGMNDPLTELHRQAAGRS